MPFIVDGEDSRGGISWTPFRGIYRDIEEIARRKEYDKDRGISWRKVTMREVTQEEYDRLRVSA